MLTERRARILQFIVGEYIGTAAPVGSQTVVRKYGLNASPATIRSEMMRLEEEGYLTQPHTSAGRMPSDKGYRYYVESLMEEEELADELKRTIRHQFYQVGRVMDAWAQLAAAILASSVGSLALVTAPHSARARLRSLELMHIREGLALLLVVLHEGRAREETIPLDRAIPQPELSRTAHRLTRLFADLAAAQMREQMVELSPFEEQITQVVIRILEDEDQSSYEPAYLQGLRNILAQPEFSRPETMLDFLEVIDEHSLPRLIPFHWAAPGDVVVIIGDENPQDTMRRCSLVVAHYGQPSGLMGALGVLGPTRLPYPRATSMVRYMGSLLGELVSLYYG